MLCCSTSTREPGTSEVEDAIAQAFRAVLPAMLRSAFLAGGETPEVSRLRFWLFADQTALCQAVSAAAGLRLSLLVMQLVRTTTACRCRSA